MWSVYGAVVCRLLLYEEMLRRSMVTDVNAYRSGFYPKGGDAHGRFTGRDDRRFSCFAANEKEAGERTGGVADPVHPTNARSAGIFKGL